MAVDQPRDRNGVLLKVGQQVRVIGDRQRPRGYGIPEQGLKLIGKQVCIVRMGRMRDSLADRESWMLFVDKQPELGLWPSELEAVSAGGLKQLVKRYKEGA